MKRFHVHLSVPDLQQSIGFYSNLFGAEPAVVKPDYAKWMLDDPRVNFAISQRGNGRTGLNHLGLQVDDDGELAGIRSQFERADAAAIVDEHEVACCYARSNKHWITDPQGIAWEAFHSLDTIPVYDGSTEAVDTASGCGSSGCCTTIDEVEPARAAQGSGASCCAPARAKEPALQGAKAGCGCGS